MRALCNREALLTAFGMVNGTVSTQNSTATTVEDGAFENVRVLTLDDHGGSLRSSWLGHVVTSYHPVYVIGVVALLVAFAAVRWVRGSWAQLAIVAMTYLFSAFVIVVVGIYERKAKADFKIDSRAASKGQGKIGELKSANRSESLGSNPSSTGDVRPALHGT
jgi:hypothetical protein